MTPERWREVTQIYGAVLSRAPERRAASIVELCGNDEELRREIESLLESQHGASLLDRPVADRPSVLQMLTIGSQIGVFRIDSLLGIGGMGEVYRARDTKLNRDVAIKILPPAFANDPDRLARFKREAQVLASLNHPNIGAIHGFEDGSGVHALVLELVEGPTLADMLDGYGFLASGSRADGAQSPKPKAQSQRRLTIDEALGIARQIADALEAAHEQGIIHRDLKPANIKVREDGTVKVLDFGLAKIAEAGATGGAGQAGRAGGNTQSPTITTPAMTAAGMILGTAAYMSPEQAKGKPADKRSDIWAFGCVLYEMLAGKRAFEAEDVAETLAAVLTRTPDFTELPATLPRAVESVLRRCLERDRRRRFADISDVRYELDEAFSSKGDARRLSEAQNQPATLRTFQWVAASSALFAIAAIATGAWVWSHSVPALTSSPLYRSQISMPAELSGQPGARLSLSPDGHRLAFVAADAGGRVLLWVRPLDAQSAQPLAGTEGAAAPFWSPDSRFIAFTAAGKLKKVDAGGGQVTPLCDTATIFPGAWNKDDVILFTADAISPLFRVSASGGVRTPVTKITGTTRHAFPAFLRDGRHFLYVAETTNGSSRHLEIGSLDDDSTTTLIDDVISPSLVEDRLLFVRGNTLFAQAFDRSIRLVGEAQPIAEDVERDPTGRFGAAYSASRSGVLVLQSSTREPVRLSWFNRSGKLLNTLGYPNMFHRVPRLSPNGKTIAVDGTPVSTINGDIWLYDVTTGAQRRFTDDPAAETYATWSPNSQRIVFASRRKGRMDLYINESDAAAGTEQLLYADDHDKFPTSWSNDGQFLLYQAVSPQTGGDVWVLPMTGEARPKLFLHSSANERSSVFSHDGRWVAYTNEDHGRTDVRVTSFPDATRTISISVAGGETPRWGRDDKELFYVSPDRMVHAVRLAIEGSDIHVLSDQTLFKLASVDVVVTQAYDVDRNGERFLAPTADDERPNVLELMVNWPTLLKQ